MKLGQEVQYLPNKATELTIKRLRSDSAPGPNELPNAPVQTGPKILELTPIFHQVYVQTFPESWHGNMFKPINKAGLWSNPSNYRPIALIDFEANMYVSRLLQDLEARMGEAGIIPLSQTGFRARMSITTNLLEVAQVYKYLGVHLDPFLNFFEHLIKRQATANTLLFAFKTLNRILQCPSHQHLLEVLNAKLLPSVTWLRIAERECCL